MKRRSFLTGAAIATIGSSGCRREPSWMRVLSNAEADALAAICSQIIPADDYPGADQAGAVTFIDIQLGGAYWRYRDSYRTGLKKANEIARTRFNADLRKLSAKDQLACVEELERVDRDFFALVVAHTMQSYYGSPRHGGNTDAVSWRMLGLSPIQLRGRNPYDLTRGNS